MLAKKNTSSGRSMGKVENGTEARSCTLTAAASMSRLPQSGVDAKTLESSSYLVDFGSPTCLKGNPGGRRRSRDQGEVLKHHIQLLTSKSRLNPIPTRSRGRYVGILDYEGSRHDDIEHDSNTRLCRYHFIASEAVAFNELRRPQFRGCLLRNAPTAPR